MSQFSPSIFRRPQVNTNITPEPGDALRGDVVNGRVVYLETRPNLKTRVKLDPLDPSKELWVRDPRTNEPIRRKMEVYQDGVTTRAYVHQDIGNGVVHKNYNFEPSPSDLNRTAVPAMSAADLQQTLQEALRRIQELEDEVNSPELSDDQVDIIIDATEEELTTVETSSPPTKRRKRASGSN